jgi:sigma-B regulation protein RsbU (phosphoserine phosphatase)
VITATRDAPGHLGFRLFVALCTDGITEARNESGEQFGRERLKESLLRDASQHATSILEGVMNDIPPGGPDA